MIETEEEIKAELQVVCTAITHMLLTGQKYSTGSGASSRSFEMVGLPELQTYRASLENRLKGVNGEAGLLLGF